jgi:hypothetical protein
MFATERMLELLGVVVLIFLVPAGFLFFLCKTVWKGSQGKVMQVFSIVISSLGIALAIVGLASATIFQGPSGEWAGIALLPAFLISLPAGIIALIISLIARTGVGRLRRASIVVSVVAILSPFIAAFVGTR